MKTTTEAAFETVIEAHLLENGYVSVAREGFDPERAIFPEAVLDFIGETQPDQWAKLEALHGDQTGEQILADLCKWMDVNGSLATLRHVRRMTPADIEGFLGRDHVIRRAERYAEEGRVEAIWVDEHGLRAHVVGGSDTPYHCVLRLWEGELEAECSCPYSRGVCWHVGAVLMVLQDDPELAARLEEKALALVTGGKSRGKYGQILGVERRPGLPTMVTLRTPEGEEVRTIIDYVFPVGVDSPIISLPRRALRNEA